MNAKTQYQLSALDLEVALALVRSGTLAEAGERLGVDASTVFRTIQRVEKGLGQRLFERSRLGYLPSELALELAAHAEQMEARLELARSAAQSAPEQVAGTVRITTTDTFLHALIGPSLLGLQKLHPLLGFELHAGNELANLTRHDADIALRATRRPPPHLVGKHIGPVRVALYGPRTQEAVAGSRERLESATWIAPDDGLPEHPSVLWRKKHYPKVQPAYRVGSILTVAELIGNGLGIGVLPMFLARGRKDLTQLSEVLDECQTELWLLTHAESRHLRRVSAVFGYLAANLSLE
ncbi:LysR family transcriptional regulator [Massilia sp. CF038]|uniref:LysR family transcriptional regulator n=1 Tax=Massilia sp. CF038 TaxID=1881045 RepID=UPI000916EB2E|nr:LysR family transcriptional regulator [Massilia sp. CF038]SHH14929.1 transcriptional regulator, LysR family [Massilia sp. CF038]